MWHVVGLAAAKLCEWFRRGREFFEDEHIIRSLADGIG